MEPSEPERAPPAGIGAEDWAGTPPAARARLVALADFASERLAALVRAAEAHFAAERFQRAWDRYTVAAAAAAALGDDPALAWLLDRLARAAAGLGDAAGAEGLARQAFAVAERTGDLQLVVPARITLGAALLDRGSADPAEAVACLRLALEEAARPDRLAALVNLGAALLRAGGLAAAAERLAEAEQMARTQDDHEQLTLCRIAQATLAGVRGARRQAVERARAAVDGAGERDSRARWLTLVTLGIRLAELGDELEGRGGGEQNLAFDEAMRALAEAATVADRLGHRQGIARALLNGAMLLSRKGDHARAIAVIEGEVLPSARARGDRSAEAFCLLNLADMRLAALAGHSQTRLDARGLPGRGLAPLGPIDVFAASDGAADWPETLADDGREATCERAVEEYQQARELLLALGDDEGLRVVFSRLGDLCARRPAKAHLAEGHYRSAIERWERARALLPAADDRINFLGRGLDPYHGLLALYAREGRAADAFLAAEQARARALVEAVARTVEQPPAPGPAFGYWGAPAASIADLRAFLAQAEAELAALPGPESPAGGRRRAVLASFALTPRALHLFVLRADLAEPQLISRPLEEDELRDLARGGFGSHTKVWELVSSEMVDNWLASSWLVEPLAAYAAPGDLVYLAPQGALHDLPLHTLEVGGEPLGLRNAVVYIPSAGLLAHCRARRRPGPDGAPLRARAAVFGDAQGNLPDARREAEVVGGLLGVDPLLGGAITGETIGAALRSCDVVHISGHARFGGEGSGEESAILLEGERAYTAREIMDLGGIAAQLVTLGCCETGVGDERPGDERIGLTRALLLGGAPAMLLSLWKVEDRSAALLMRRFYGYLRAEPALSAADALRQAMRDVRDLDEWSSFYFWAPFILIGDWR